MKPATIYKPLRNMAVLRIFVKSRAGEEFPRNKHRPPWWETSLGWNDDLFLRAGYDEAIVVPGCLR